MNILSTTPGRTFCLALALSAAATTKTALAIEWGPISITSGTAGFCFDITVVDIPSVSNEIEFRMYTKVGAIIVQNNQMQTIADIHTSDGSVLDGPRVEPIGTPDRDRWLLGDLEEFMVSQTIPGTWQFVGRISNGTDPFLPGDNFGEIRVNYSGGSLAFLSHGVEAGCGDSSTPPESVPVMPDWAVVLLASLLGLVGFSAVKRRQQGHGP